MLDPNFIRENPEQVKAALRDLNTEAPIDEILELDRQRREILKEVEALRQERNAGSKAIGRLMGQGKKAEAEAKKAEIAGLGDKISQLDGQLRQVEADLTDKQLYVPNMPGPGVPVGPDESHNVEVRRWGEPPRFDFPPKPHWELGEGLGIIDFERGVKMSGTRFYLFKGAGAALHRALTNWFIDVGVREHGYTEIYPPFMVREQAMIGAAHLPKFRDNMYHDAEEDYWFIGTAEVPLTNLFADEILEADQLPIKYLAHTPCFRREKMSAGRDVRGIKRVHQFEKVEMYHYTRPEESYAHLEEIVANAEDLCRRLNLPYRVVQMCTGDLGFAAAKKYDLEAWVPGEHGQGEWLEISRLMIAVLENYQQADGSVVVPEVLRPYMGGLEVIRA
jgi:seryl-tRNA synthetase